MNTYLSKFIECHDGIINKLIHIAGFALIGLGIFEKKYPLSACWFCDSRTWSFLPMGKN